MEHRGCHIFGLILVSWVAKTAFGQGSNCLFFGQYVASSSYNTTITSPNYPLNYDNNLDCSWLIEVNNSIPSFQVFVVKVTFNDFWLGYGSGPCTKDVISFYDGMSSGSSLLGSLCGTTPPEVIYSTGKYLYVTFNTDSVITYKGFSFSFSAVREEEATGICRSFDGKDYRVSGSSGTFFTPNYPFPYRGGSSCVWIISVPAGKVVKLTFEDFHIDTVSPNCTTSSNPKDYVQIRDGEGIESKRLVVACGYGGVIPPVVYSTGRYMWVRFSSISLGSWQLSKGFKAHFKATVPDYKEVCFPENPYNIDLKLTGYNGTLRSPLSPDGYPPDLLCDWLITVPEGKAVKLRFDSFELEPSSGCTADYVEILDGKFYYSGSIGKFCGYTTPLDIRSSGRYMQVKFRADLTNSHYDGFTATFTAEGKPSTVPPMPSNKPSTVHPTLTDNDSSDSSSSTWIIGVVVGVAVFIVLVSCIVLTAMRNKTPNRAVNVGMPMSSAYHAAQPGVIQHPPSPHIQPLYQPAANPYPPPPVGYAPASANLSLAGAANPDPSEPPPAYPGEGTVLQYPPPGQSYPWLQRASVKASASPGSP